MKLKIAFSYILSVCTLGAFAQNIENDDMYFNSSDRAKLNAQKNAEVAYSSVKKSQRAMPAEEQLNPTDSYSARNVNPEYAARSNAQTAQMDNEDYFVSNYQYNTAANLNNWNNNFNDRYANQWYQTNYWGPAINRWNTPFYGSPYDAWGNPWNNPYYRSGFSSSFSYHWGSAYNYGWDMGMGGMGMGMGGMGMGFGNPYYGNAYNAWGWGNPHSYWGGGAGWGGGYWGNGFHSPRNIVVVNNNSAENSRSNISYGKRTTRGTYMVNEAQNTNNRTRATMYSNEAPNTGRNTSTGGRTSTRQEEYYNRSWRYTAPAQNSNSGSAPTRTSDYNNNNNSNTGSSPYNQRPNSNNNSYNSGSRMSTPSSAPARTGGGGGGSTGGGSQGRTRTR